MSSVHTSSACQRVLSIQELADSVASYLAPSDLFRCVQVHSSWNLTLIPSLWNTIDDSLYRWPEFIDEHNPHLPKEVKDPQDWMLAVFKKYGHHIRHLRISFLVTIEAAFASTHCVHLQSLGILFNQKLTKAEIRESSRMQSLRGGLSWPERQKLGEAGPFEAPEFEGAIIPAQILFRIKSVQRTDWITFQRSWLLVRRNRSLMALKIGQSLLTLGRISSPTVFIDLLAALPNLGTFEHNLHCLDGYQLLVRLAHLHSFSSMYYHVPEALDHRKTYKNIRSFGRPHAISQLHVAWILKDFPNLECLALGWIDTTQPSDPEAFRIIGNSPLKLRELRVASANEHRELNIWVEIISLCPELRRFVANNLTRQVVDTLVQHSRKLVELRQNRDDTPIVSIQYWTQTLNGLLESCPDLKILDCINCAVQVPDWEDEVWVCAGLETFRCQIVGFDRLSKEEERVLEDIAETRKAHQLLSFGGGRRQPVGKELRCLEQHYRMYDRLSALTSLRVIDLGGGYRDDMLLLDDNAPFYEVDGYEYLRYGGPMENSMELSLSSGLSRLATLRRIEVFGFEGVDHRIGKAELKWMATSWPRLREMRGLHVDTLPYIEFDLHKAVLRKYMRVLRPEVKQLGYGCRKDDGTEDEPPLLGPRTIRPWATVAPSSPTVAVAPRRQRSKALCCFVQ
ncbi:hypothetical protein KI688_005231 [Linnemannia hyalina]|uniref:F-box domain-containing protein n=1 Tax=Linnemannia hyalina TaxID=64524 RepID=A0A9P7XKM8_9FUNG|nr:hypothetical protein KI688_005231 [Linnemannia hyalina]